MKYTDYTERVKIDSLQSDHKYVAWNLDRQVNVLSGVSGVDKDTILNRVIKSLLEGGDFSLCLPKEVHIAMSPADVTAVRYDIIRSFDRSLMSPEMIAKVDISLATELDWRLSQLQRKYLNYQVNVGNRTIKVLRKGGADAAVEAQRVSVNKLKSRDAVDRPFAGTGEAIARVEDEIRFVQMGEKLLPYQLSSGKKQVLAILLTVLVENRLPCALLMDEPEVSSHVSWQE